MCWLLLTLCYTSAVVCATEKVTHQKMDHSSLSLSDLRNTPIRSTHDYYDSTITEDEATAQHYWIDANDRVLNLPASYRKAAIVPLPFKFPFYGYEINNVTITTGGFLSTHDYLHSWIAACQYVAPLMANFDIGLSVESFVRYFSNSTTFTVLWENVLLHDHPEFESFTFEVTLRKNGDIIFVYKNVPDIIDELTENYHPVKIGVSDGYILDRKVIGMTRKTLYEYHRILFDKIHLKNGTVIYLKALPTCLSKTSCELCLEKDTTFDCQWCNGRCSSGIDRKRSEWLENDCDHKKINETQYCPTRVDTSVTFANGTVSSNNCELTEASTFFAQLKAEICKLHQKLTSVFNLQNIRIFFYSIFA